MIVDCNIFIISNINNSAKFLIHGVIILAEPMFWERYINVILLQENNFIIKHFH